MGKGLGAGGWGQAQILIQPRPLCLHQASHLASPASLGSGHREMDSFFPSLSVDELMIYEYIRVI